MLLYEESKALEKAIGEEAAAVVAKVFERQNEVTNAETASKTDLRETEMRLQLEIEKVKSETEKVRGEVKETEARLRVDIEKTRSDLLRWQIGIGFALGAFMLAGFGTLGAVMARGFGRLGF